MYFNSIRTMSDPFTEPFTLRCRHVLLPRPTSFTWLRRRWKLYFIAVLLWWRHFFCFCIQIDLYWRTEKQNYSRRLYFFFLSWPFHSPQSRSVDVMTLDNQSHPHRLQSCKPHTLGLLLSCRKMHSTICIKHKIAWAWGLSNNCVQLDEITTKRRR